MTVTRRRLDSAPGVAPHGWDAPAVPVAASTAETREDRDRLKVLLYFGARAGMRRTATQVVAGTHLPISRALEALDALVGCGYLTRTELRRTPAGWVPTWARHDPQHSPEEQP